MSNTILGYLNDKLQTLVTQGTAWNSLVSLSAPFTSRALTTAATVSILTSAPGMLHTVVVGMLSCPTLTLYDNASGASGSILALVEPGAKNTYVYDTTVLNGITAMVQAGNAPLVHVTTKP